MGMTAPGSAHPIVCYTHLHTEYRRAVQWRTGCVYGPEEGAGATRGCPPFILDKFQNLKFPDFFDRKFHVFGRKMSKI